MDRNLWRPIQTHAGLRLSRFNFMYSKYMYPLRLECKQFSHSDYMNCLFTLYVNFSIYLNDSFFLIISCVKGILDRSLKTKSALKASINMMINLPNFGGGGLLDFSSDGSTGSCSCVALPFEDFFNGKNPLRNSERPMI